MQKRTEVVEEISPCWEQSTQQRVSNDWVVDALLISLDLDDDRAASGPAGAAITHHKSYINS